MLVIKGATTQTFLFFKTLRLVRFCKCFKEQNFSVKTSAYAKFAYRTVSNFNNTKFEKLHKAELLKLEISTFGLFFLLCQY